MVSLETFEVDITQPYYMVEYELGSTFFGLFGQSLVEKGKLTATIKVTRRPKCVQLLFSIRGVVVLVCDRSLVTFDYPVNLEKEVIFKLGYENKEIDENFYIIEQHTTTLNIAQHQYDFISLAVPMKKIHPQWKHNDDEL